MRVDPNDKNTILETDIETALSGFDDESEEDNRKMFFHILHKICEDGSEHIREADDYAEPGYSLDNDEMPILFADWNKKGKWNRETNSFDVLSNLMPLLSELAEKVGCSMEWSDEWKTCECRKAFRTSPDSYGWKQYGVAINDENVCGDCITGDPSDYFQSISGDPRQAITIEGLDPTAYGWARVDSEQFEYGVMGGQDASPEVIAETLKSADIEDFIFSIDSTGQFDLRFSVFVREDVLEKASEVLRTGNTQCEMDPAEGLRRGLAAVAQQANTGEGVQYNRVDVSTGEATTRTLTPEEFVKGVK